MEHTKLPWSLAKDCIISHEENGHIQLIAELPRWDIRNPKDPQYIVKACNLYPELVEALRGFDRVIKAFNGMLLARCKDDEIVGALDGLLDLEGVKLEQVLAKAEE